jgi:hypothetical protein
MILWCAAAVATQRVGEWWFFSILSIIAWNGGADEWTTMVDPTPNAHKESKAKRWANGFVKMTVCSERAIVK